METALDQGAHLHGLGEGLMRNSKKKKKKSSSKNLLLSDLQEGIHFQPSPPHCSADRCLFSLLKSSLTSELLKLPKKAVYIPA